LLRISGTFRLDSPERFAETLTELFPLELTYSEDGSILLSPAEQ
jgi:ferric-dicitrate binding protein FerR (iron transport regulator)